MESTHETPHQFSSTGNTPPSRDLGSAAEKAGKSARAAGEQFSDAASEKLGQAKQMVGDVYDQVNRTVSDKYNQAVDYGRENPGKTTLIAFGVGVGVGLLMMGNIRRSHRPSRRVVQPVVNALSNLACDLFA
jgi:ElaB/YqjD/DUF883 family membrane-anchored ribosome-binding protein